MLMEVLGKNKVLSHPFTTIAKNRINVPEMNVICTV